MRREACSACGHTGLDQFLDLGTSPVADAYTDTAEESMNLERYPLQVAVCNKCYLVQLLEVLPHEMLFGTGYSFYTSASPPLSRYHKRYADVVLETYPDHAKTYTLEIGCNDGDLLQHFDMAGCRTLGVDPATGPAEVARKRGLDVRTRPFGERFARDLLDQWGPATLVIANHVLAHVADVSDMLAGISVILAGDGVAIIEVQYLPDLLVNNAFDLVYHEHRNFFSLSSLETAALRHGLHLSDLRFTTRQGGSLRATFTKSKAPYAIGEGVKATERWLQSSGPYEGFQGRVERIRDRLLGLLAPALVEEQVAGYGAPAKATTLLNFCGLTGDDLEFTVDTTTAKRHKFIPGTGIRIIGPGDPHIDVDTYLLLAWNYQAEIIRKHLDFIHSGGGFIIPIPSPVLI
jgi:hypothetical protein